MVQCLTDKLEIYLEGRYITPQRFIDIDCLLNVTVLKLIHPLHSRLVTFSSFLFMSIYVFVILAYIHLFL